MSGWQGLTYEAEFKLEVPAQPVKHKATDVVLAHRAAYNRARFELAPVRKLLCLSCLK
jgi:hypothetical protein